MFTSIYCIAHQHNPWLVALAAIVCGLSAAASLRLLSSGRRARQAEALRLRLLIISGVCWGAGVWATHFIAMLAFDPGMMTAYEPVETLASLAIALGGGAVGAVLALKTPPPWRYLVWGLAFAASAGGMHYMGMAALRVPGDIAENPALMAASVVAGGLLATLALWTALRFDGAAGFVGATCLMVAATCALHFLGMASVRITPDPLKVAAAGAIPRQVLAIVVGALTVAIAMIGLWTIWIETRSQKQSHNLIHSVIDAIPQALAYFDPTDGYVLGNQAYVKELTGIGLKPGLGLPYETILRRTFAQQLAQMPSAQAQSLIDDHLQARRGASSAFDLPMPDGRFLRVETNRTALGGIVTVVSDITGLKRQAEELGRARDLAEAADRAKSAFLANMSHELRTPMNGVVAVADLLAVEVTTPRKAELVDLIRASSARLMRILSDILDISQAESGELEIHRAPFDLVAAVTSVVWLFRPDADAKGLAVDLTIEPPGEHIVQGDEARLKQVLGSLLANAVKFTDRGRVELSVVVDEQSAVFRVADTGVGVDAGLGERIFERFEQADGTITRRFGGAGLGLSIARDLVRLMDGELTYDSTPGEGSIFTVRLPLAACAAAPSAAALGEAADTASPARILVADDNATNQRVLMLMLEGAGVDTSLAANGQEAVDAWRTGGFDAILMDIQMPVMDGLTAVRTIRAAEAREGRAATPIIMVSANAAPEHLAASASAGANAHLAKPVTAAQLFAALAALDAPQAQREAPEQAA